VSRRPAPRLHRGAEVDSDVFQRQLIFWLAALLLFVLVFWLLSEILLPFIAGLAIAYLLTPLTDRLERLDVNRLAAVGLLVAVPLAATIGVLSRFALRHYLQSSFYTSENAD